MLLASHLLQELSLDGLVSLNREPLMVHKLPLIGNSLNLRVGLAIERLNLELLMSLLIDLLYLLEELVKLQMLRVLVETSSTGLVRNRVLVQLHRVPLIG